MIEKIQRIATNPLEAASREDKEALTKERLGEINKKNKNKWMDFEFWKGLCIKKDPENGTKPHFDDTAILE